MKTKSILICLLFAISANSFITAKAQVNVNDSLALVDLYNNTNGHNWRHHTNWLTTMPVSTWYGVTVSDNRVTSLSLNSNKLSGTISASIGNLINLYQLILNHNQLTGTIPAEIGNLINLKDLELYDNQLSGTIPAEIGNLTTLTALKLYINQLTGTIPAALGNLTRLKYLYLSSNQLTGTIPAALGNLKNLYYLYLSRNQLTGTIPAALGNLTNLYYLYSSSNQLTGTIPASFVKLKYLQIIDLSYNQLSQFGEVHTANGISYISCYINNNLFTFDGLQAGAKYYYYLVYAPQDTILPIHQNGNVLSVSAGGTLSKNRYNWFKAGATDSTTIKGDSTFHPTQSGKYYAHITNSVATKLTLYSDTISYIMPLAATQNSVANVAAAKAFTNHFSIYPNPAKDVIHVGVNGNAFITLTNSAGKILLSKTINNSGEINVSSYANGTYYIQNKTTGETQKIIVVH